jgi:hypothetical protein
LVTATDTCRWPKCSRSIQLWAVAHLAGFQYRRHELPSGKRCRVVWPRDERGFSGRLWRSPSSGQPNWLPSLSSSDATTLGARSRIKKIATCLHYLPDHRGDDLVDQIASQPLWSDSHPAFIDLRAPLQAMHRAVPCDRHFPLHPYVQKHSGRIESQSSGMARFPIVADAAGSTEDALAPSPCL